MCDSDNCDFNEVELDKSLHEMECRLKGTFWKGMLMLGRMIHACLSAMASLKGNNWDSYDRNQRKAESALSEIEEQQS
jgi:hypothetical protein